MVRMQAARWCPEWKTRTALLLAAGLLASAAMAADDGAVRIAPLSVGGEASASVAPKDVGYFNDHEYGRGALRLARVRLTAEWRIRRTLAALGEVRYENGDHPRLYGLYLRLRPWSRGPLDLQAGQVPQLFGAYPRRSYAADNTLIGEPLAYQYLTAMRDDAGPAAVDDLLRMRARGWRTRYPLGSSSASAGLATINTQRWDVGVQARLSWARIEAAAGVTKGSLGNPRVNDDNDGKNVVFHAAWRPRMGLVLGVSAAQGRYLARELEASLGRRRQRALGADGEYSRGRTVLRTEWVRFGWGAPFADYDLAGWSGLVEARVKLIPGLNVAARADRIAFDRILAPRGWTPWEYAVSRVEAGASFAPARHILLKAEWQHNERDGGTVRHESFVAAQALVWF
jgi:hypothetical protein